jgi:hypothetical protein
LFTSLTFRSARPYRVKSDRELLAPWSIEPKIENNIHSFYRQSLPKMGGNSIIRLDEQKMAKARVVKHSR